jgi:hypothetical protein
VKTRSTASRNRPSGACLHHLGLHLQVFAQRLHAGIAGFCGIGLEDGAARQRSDAENGVDFAVHVGNALRQHAIDLGQRHAATPDTQQLQDFQMLHGLGHDAVVGSHDQQGVVNAHGAGGHGVDEFLVARHVDDAQHIAVGQRAVGITEFYGDAAGFSSLRRSVSTPVSARTSVVLPWSIWPAVPMIMVCL